MVWKQTKICWNSFIFELIVFVLQKEHHNRKLAAVRFIVCSKLKMKLETKNRIRMLMELIKSFKLKLKLMKLIIICLSPDFINRFIMKFQIETKSICTKIISFEL